MLAYEGSEGGGVVVADLGLLFRAWVRRRKLTPRDKCQEKVHADQLLWQLPDGLGSWIFVDESKIALMPYLNSTKSHTCDRCWSRQCWYQYSSSQSSWCSVSSFLTAILSASSLGTGEFSPLWYHRVLLALWSPKKGMGLHRHLGIPKRCLDEICMPSSGLHGNGMFSSETKAATNIPVTFWTVWKFIQDQEVKEKNNPGPTSNHKCRRLKLAKKV